MCQSSFIFLVSIRVIQCAGKREGFLKIDRGHVSLWEEPLVENENEFKAQISACHWQLKMGTIFNRFHSKDFSVCVKCYILLYIVNTEVKSICVYVM